MNITNARLLSFIGEHPEATKEELTEMLQINQQTVYNYIYSFRERGYVVKTPKKRHNDTGYNFELTGIGYRAFEEWLEGWLNAFKIDYSLNKEEYHLYSAYTR